MKGERRGTLGVQEGAFLDMVLVRFFAPKIAPSGLQDCPKTLQDRTPNVLLFLFLIPTDRSISPSIYSSLFSFLRERVRAAEVSSCPSLRGMLLGWWMVVVVRM